MYFALLNGIKNVITASEMKWCIDGDENVEAFSSLEDLEDNISWGSSSRYIVQATPIELINRSAYAIGECTFAGDVHSLEDPATYIWLSTLGVDSLGLLKEAALKGRTDIVEAALNSGLYSRNDVYCTIQYASLDDYSSSFSIAALLEWLRKDDAKHGLQ